MLPLSLSSKACSRALVISSLTTRETELAVSGDSFTEEPLTLMVMSFPAGTKDCRFFRSCSNRVILSIS